MSFSTQDLTFRILADLDALRMEGGASAVQECLSEALAQKFPASGGTLIDAHDCATALRAVGASPTVWVFEDFIGIVAEDEDFESMSEEAIENAANRLLDECGDLDTHVTQHGNDFIASKWAGLRSEILEEISDQPPAP